MNPLTCLEYVIKNVDYKRPIGERLLSKIGQWELTQSSELNKNLVQIKIASSN